jgi:hypothetical protein
MLSAFSDVVSAASRPSGTATTESRASLSSNAEVGFFVDTVSTPKLPRLPFFKADRAFFKVWIAGKQLDDGELISASPLTLGGSSNLFPVETNRRSWIPVSEKTTNFANLLCRLPLDLVSLIDSNNRLIVGKDIVLQLSNENGGGLGEFNIKRDVPYVISQLVNLRDTSTMSTLTVRPGVRLKAVDLKWKPDDAKIRAGDSLAISVSAVDSPLFPFEFSLTQSGSEGAGVNNLPGRVTLSPSRPLLSLNLQFALRPR